MYKSRLSPATRFKSANPVVAPAVAPAQNGQVVCPVCGGLECLCRPRFFSGQLLTEEDLNRLEYYITAKNRLHNRMLTGWGVVNGLEVTCGQCNNQVVVSAGYALSPCGDDILVCQDVPVDICALVNACCTSTQTTDCGPYSPPAPQDCQDVEQKWILAICYDETPSRGVTPLRSTGSQACCSRCNCGGSATCGCGCHKNQAKTSMPRLSTTSQPAPNCEPTVICEGYRFTVFQPAQPSLSTGTGRTGLSNYGRVSALAVAGTATQGDLGQRFLDCIADLLVLANNLKPPANATVQDLYNWCCSLKTAFQDFLSQHGGTACTLYDVLSTFLCPDPSQFANDPAAYQQAIEAEIGQLTGVMQQYIYGCLCSALLPPVPPASADNCVPIATVTLRRKDCRIINICNTDVRKFAVTFTTLGYWLSPLVSLINNFRQALNRLCCGGVIIKQAVPVQSTFQSHAFVMRSAAFVNPLQDEAANFIPRVQEAWARRNQAADPRAMILDALGLAQASGAPYMSPLDRANPGQSLLLDNVVMPFISSLTGQAGQPGSVTGEVKGPVQPPAGEGGAAAPAVEDTAVLKARLDELAALVEKQQAMIEELQKRRGRK